MLSWCSRCQAKFLTFAKLMIYFCMSIVSLLRVRESTLAMKCLMSVAKIKFLIRLQTFHNKRQFDLVLDVN